jgi:hypothetical protein
MRATRARRNPWMAKASMKTMNSRTWMRWTGIECSTVTARTSPISVAVFIASAPTAPFQDRSVLDRESRRRGSIGCERQFSQKPMLMSFCGLCSDDDNFPAYHNPSASGMMGQSSETLGKLPLAANAAPPAGFSVQDLWYAGKLSSSLHRPQNDISIGCPCDEYSPSLIKECVHIVGIAQRLLVIRC